MAVKRGIISCWLVIKYVIMESLTLPGLYNRDGFVKIHRLVVARVLGEQVAAGLEGNGPVDEVQLRNYC